jgi:NADH-quinone oxidoreductase E subunit
LEGLHHILANYPDKRSALLPLLNKAQEQYGWLSPDAMESVAEALGLTASHVRGVATFHVLYRKQKPARHMVQLCTNITCMILGAETLLDVLAGRFDLRPGRTSGDGRFSLLVMECIGACDKAPAMVVDSELHQVTDKEALIRILEGYR